MTTDNRIVAATLACPVVQTARTRTRFMILALISGGTMINYGRIVNVASMSGKDGVQYICGYSAAKAGVIAFTKAAKELAQGGVLLN